MILSSKGDSKQMSDDATTDMAPSSVEDVPANRNKVLSSEMNS